MKNYNTKYIAPNNAFRKASVTQQVNNELFSHLLGAH